MTYEIKYRREEEMKDSGIKWLGKVPEDWIISKIKNIAALKTGNSISANDKDNKYSKLISEYYSYIGTKDINLNTNNIEYDNGLYIPKTTDFKTAKKHTSLICIEGGSAGRKLGYLDRKVCFGNKLCNIEGNKKITNKLLYYIIQSEYFSVEFFNKTTGIIPGVSIEEFKNIISVLPISNEQQKIANFLDLKTAEFDSIISKKELLIEKLDQAKKSLISEVVTGKVKIVDGQLVERKADEMKDSGVEWLGVIPKDWEVIKLSKITNRIGDGIHGTPIYDDNGEYYFINGNNIKNGIITINQNTKIVPYLEYKKYYVKLNFKTLLMSINGTIGDLAFYNKEDIILGKSAAYINLKEKNNINYIYYFLQSQQVKTFYNLEVTGSTIKNLSLRTIRNTKILRPSFKEELRVSKFLQVKVIEVDSIIAKTKLQIQKLKEAKQSLISEAVTGKIDLRDWVIEAI